MATAFVPAHITGFFCPYKHRNKLKTGSVGVGICISEGINADVKAYKSSIQKINIYFNNKLANAQTTLYGIKKLIGDLHYEIYVKLKFKLPISQGFGLSASGTLATLLALNKELNLGYNYENIVGIAHESDVANLTGLGDVIAEATGGFVHRIAPGAPPYGKTVKLQYKFKDVVLCIVGKKMHTKNVLCSQMDKISRIGKACIESFYKNPTQDNFFIISRNFAIYTGLANEKIKTIFDKYEYCSQSMLGNSIFAVGKNASFLSAYGKVYRTTIYEQKGDVIENG